MPSYLLKIQRYFLFTALLVLCPLFVFADGTKGIDRLVMVALYFGIIVAAAINCITCFGVSGKRWQKWHSRRWIFMIFLSLLVNSYLFLFWLPWLKECNEEFRIINYNYYIINVLFILCSLYYLYKLIAPLRLKD
jgi:hypothetical protein